MSILQELLNLNESSAAKPHLYKGTCNQCGHETTASTDRKEPIACKWGKCNGTVKLARDPEVKDKPIAEDAIQVDEKVFDEEKYDWYVWTERRPSPVIERRGSTVQLERGRTFGLRKATSKKDNTYRLVLKSHGPSIIYSIPERLALDLINAAAPAH